MVGGGGLISLPTMLLMGIPIHSAIAADKFGAAISTLLTSIESLRKKEIKMSEITIILIIGFLSGLTGGFVANELSAQFLNYVAISLMTFAFAMSFFTSNYFGHATKITNKKKVYPLLFSVGFYDGIFGPGSSTLSIYVLSNDRLTYFKAVTLTRISLLAWCSGALISYISSGVMIWSIAFSIMAGAILGGFAGVYLSKRINVKYIKHVLRLMTLIIIIQLILKVV
ncbi:MAG: sulfite exporter TauE/SafE family protein [Kurthia sp.]|nr:sulfite exporter TauE/SafE family protein [Candidatus Kurthia equi]